MKKLNLSLMMFFGLLIGMHFKSEAQVKFGVNGGVGIPMRAFENDHQVGYVGEANLKIFISDYISIGALAGYHRYRSEHAGQQTSIFPFAGQLELYLTPEGFRPYIGADVGAYMFRERIDLPEQSQVTHQRHFGVAPTIGFLIEVVRHVDVNLSLKYHTILTGDRQTDRRNTTILQPGLGIYVSFGD